MRRICFAIVLFCFFSVAAQNPTDIIKIKEPNEKYLEHLIKIKIDSVRATLGIKTLANDSSLYVVAKFHAQYLNDNNKVGHSQLSDTFRTPDLRLKFFNVHEYFNTEMVHSVYVHRPISVKLNPNEKEVARLTFTTYQEVANYIVREWQLDKDTEAQFKDPKYNVIGLSVVINHLNDCIKIVSFFGRPYLKYEFKANKTMFPYSTYEQTPLITSFTEVKTPAILDRPYKIVEAKEGACTKCSDAIKGVNFKLISSSGRIYLVADGITNPAFEKFIASSKNGFLLETIEYEDYHPGNPAYFEKPTRRNGKYIYNGEITTPITGDDLIKGYNPNTGALKVYLSKDYKIKTLYDFNLYVIYKSMLCEVQRFTDPVGNGLALFETQKLAYNIGEGSKDTSYVFNNSLLNYNFGHKGNYFEIDEAKLTKEVAALQKADSNRKKSQITVQLFVPLIDTDTIHTIAKSVEAVKSKLSKIYPDANLSVEVRENIAIFHDQYKKLKNDDKAKMSAEEWKKAIKDPKELAANKVLLDKSWHGTLSFLQYEDSLKQLERTYMAQMAIFDTLKEVSEKQITYIKEVQRLLFERSIATNTPINKSACQFKKINPSLAQVYQNQLNYNYNSITNHTEDTVKYFYKYLLNNYKSKSASIIDKVNFLKISCNHMSNQPLDFEYRSNVLNDELKKLKAEIAEKDYTKLANAYDVKLTYYYSFYSKAASLFEANLQTLFEKYKNGDMDSKYKLALTMAYYGRLEKANELLTPYIGDDSKEHNMIVLYNKINQVFVDVNGKTNTEYMNTLMKSINSLGKDKWCGQFVGQGNISFQIFDYFPLYEQYCKECAPYNNAARSFPY